MKETELLADFIRDVFVDLLGYVPPPTTPYTLKREALVKVDGKFADAGFGIFGQKKWVRKRCRNRCSVYCGTKPIRRVVIPRAYEYYRCMSI